MCCLFCVLPVIQYDRVYPSIAIRNNRLTWTALLMITLSLFLAVGIPFITPRIKVVGTHSIKH